MKTLIFDMDGTLTDMWPLEKAVLLEMLGKDFEGALENSKAQGLNSTYSIYSKLSRSRLPKNAYIRCYNKTFNTLMRQKKLPRIEKYPLAYWIERYRSRYRSIYATGGQRRETLYVLRSLNPLTIFDISNSLDKAPVVLPKQPEHH